MENRLKALIRGFQNTVSAGYAPELSGIGRLFGDRLFTDNTDIKNSFNTGKNNYKKAYEYYKNNYPVPTKAGEVLGYGGATITGLKALNIARQKVYYDRLRNGYERYKLGKAFDEVNAEPLKGNRKGKDDVMATIKPNKRETYYIHRGAAVKDDNGNIIVQDNPKNPDPEILKRKTGTSGNFGIVKATRLHGITKSELKELPNIIRKYQPILEDNDKVFRIAKDIKHNYRSVFKPYNGTGERLITMTPERIAKKNPKPLSNKIVTAVSERAFASPNPDTNLPEFAFIGRNILANKSPADSAVTINSITQSNKKDNRKTARELLKFKDMTLEDYIKGGKK